MSNFRQFDRETGYLPPPSLDDWLPERHLARFVVEVIEQLDLSPFVKAYRGSGSAAHHPSVLLGLLIHGYATRVYSSRKLERATYDSVAFRFIAANDHPDHDTIATFRRRFLPAIEQLFVGVLMLARQVGMPHLGTVALDGTKIHADASRHNALSWKHARQIEAKPRAEVAELMALAEAADVADVPDGMSVPEELARREDRLAAIAVAKAAIEGRALYALRKQTPEPVFGIIKSVMGFRRFSLRDLDQAKGEWNLVTLAWNIKRMFALIHASEEGPPLFPHVTRADP